MNKISVICVYNNKDLFEKSLLSSLRKQDVEYELISLDNTNGAFHSAAAALNCGCAASSGDIIVFSHQDIFLKSSTELRTFCEMISNLPVGCIIGTQGVKEPFRQYYSNITAGDDYIQEFRNEYEYKCYEVSCVDEGFFGMRRETWVNHHFDEELCDNWHLYAVEQSLYARKHSYKVYVYPIQLHHFSYGTISLSYMNGLKKLCDVYRRDFKYIWTTCYKVRTNKIYINTLVFIWVINRKMRGRPL